MSLRLPIPSPVAHTVRHVGCILPVAGQCSLPESVSGFHAALDNEPRAVLGHLVVVPALLELPPDFARGIVSWLRHGATVIVESGAAFTGQLSFRRHRRSLRDGLQLAVHAPVRLWSEQRPSRRTPYVDYTWPHPAKIRDFSRVVPLGDQPGALGGGRRRQTLVAFHPGMIAVLALCVATTLAAQGRNAHELVWGGDAEGGAPFVEADPANPSQVRGFDVEVAGRIAHGLGRRSARFLQVQWSNIDQSVERGDFVLGLSGVEDTPARRARHAVTLPYFEFREVLAVRPEDRDRVHGLADLRGRRVATLGATIAYDLLVTARGSAGVIPVSYDDDVHPYADLVAGRVDAVLLDHIIAQRALRRRGGSGFVILAQPVAISHYVGVLARADSVP